METSLSRNLNNDELFMIAIQLDLPDLLNFCATDKRHNEFCKKDRIWNSKLNKYFPEYEEYFSDKSKYDKYKLLHNLSMLRESLQYYGDLYSLYQTKTFVVDGSDKRHRQPFIIPKAGLPKEMSVLENLERIEVKWCIIKQISIGILLLPKLYSLNLDINIIETIPKEIGNLKNLTKLSLNNNKIKSIPEEIGNLRNLRTLSLNNNLIQTIPKEIGNLINLETLSLNYNKIKSVPEEVGLLENLKYLFIEGNQIKRVPKVVIQLPKLVNNYELPKTMLQEISGFFGY